MTNRNSNNINIPEAREAMDKFKMEAASEVGVNLECEPALAISTGFPCFHSKVLIFFHSRERESVV